MSGGFDPRRVIQESSLGDVHRLFLASEGRIVVGSRCAGITLLDTTTDEATTVYYNDNQSNRVTDIAEDTGNRLWVGIGGIGVARVEGTHVEVLGEDEPWIPARSISAVAIDRSGSVWVGTHDGIGILRADGSSDIIMSNDILPSKTVWGITIRRDGQVWCLTEKGYAVFDAGAWTYPAFSDFSPSRTSVLFEAADGSTWFGGPDGARRNPPFRLQEQNSAE